MVDGSKGGVRAVLHPVHGPGLAEGLRTIDRLDLVSPETVDGVLDELANGAEALFTFEWDDRFATPSLAWVQAISAGVDQFPVDVLRESDVVLTSARGAQTPAVAEHAVALLWACVRGIGPAVRRSARHEWQPKRAAEVRGLTVTIVGMGSIGTEVARMLSLLGATVIGVRRNPAPSDYAERVVGVDQLLDVLARSDAVVCALPNSDDTQHLIGNEALNALGHGWLVNVGRGSTLDEEALAEALVDGDLIGAGIDVTEVEPLPEDSPLWDIENLIITPHMAWSSSGLTPRLVSLIAENVDAYLGERPWVNQVA